MSDHPPFVGGCYCGAIRYEAIGKPVFKAQCHCRECQYISGGGPNYFLLMPEDGLRWSKGKPKQFTRSDIDPAVTRSFCGTCGTHLTTHLPHSDNVVVKVGTLDDPSRYGGPAAAIHTADAQPFHLYPEGAPTFEKLPPRA